MRISFKSRAARPRRWILDLAGRLEAHGHRVAFDIAKQPEPGPHEAGLNLLFTLESLLYGLPEARASAVADWPRRTDDWIASSNLVIDFSGDALAEQVAGATLIPLQDGAVGDAGAATAILDGRSPVLSVAYRKPGDGGARVVATALPALEEPSIFTRSLDRVLARLSGVVLRVIERLTRGEPASTMPSMAHVRLGPPPNVIGAATFLTSSLSAKIGRRLRKLSAIESHWRIGWRWTSGNDIASRLVWPAAPYAFLPDDAKRFYADPFIFWKDGVAHVFCEEYPYATGKGVISVFAVGQDGVIGSPRVVLERPYHLSYPMVFERDGAIFMIPETSANRTVELYRSTCFPDEWALEAVLVNDVSAADATLVERDGRLWLLAAIVEDGASTWDALGLFSAARLKGPWTAHPLNPVLIDAGSARPAGLTFARGNELIRPAQDCARGYGSALALCRVDKLDPEMFAQTCVALLAPLPEWGAQGTHTLNFANGLEVIDCTGWRPRRG
jgi:hypothetical protein